MPCQLRVMMDIDFSCLAAVLWNNSELVICSTELVCCLVHCEKTQTNGAVFANNVTVYTLIKLLLLKKRHNEIEQHRIKLNTYTEAQWGTWPLACYTFVSVVLWTFVQSVSLKINEGNLLTKNQFLFLLSSITASDFCPFVWHVLIIYPSFRLRRG